MHTGEAPQQHPRAQRGQSVVEMALILPIFLLAILGVVDLGRAVYTEVILTSAVREGCRAAVIQSNTNATIIQAVLNAAPGITLPAGNITISGTRTSGSSVTVSAFVVYTPVTPGIQQLAGSSIQLRGTSVMVVD